MPLDYIPIKKITETPDAALYAFRIEDQVWGRFWIDRASGTVRLEQAPDTPGIEGYFARASHRVRRAWESGDFPVRTCWAS
jgi:hypothetical protein